MIIRFFQKVREYRKNKTSGIDLFIVFVNLKKHDNHDFLLNN